MESKQLIPYGGLNLDDDPSNLPDGDYIDAQNMIFGPDVDGQGNAVKKYPGLTQAHSAYSYPFAYTNAVMVDATEDYENGAVFFLMRETTSAWIMKYVVSTDTLSLAVPKYNHGGCTLTRANLRVLGDMIFWNYLNNGEPLSYYLQRDASTDTIGSNTDSILLAKEAPVTMLNVTATINSAVYRNPMLCENDFEFTYRWVYDSGERSVLCQPFTLCKGRNNIQNISIDMAFWSSAPDYVTAVEIYCRKTNDGVWVRIRTHSSTTDIEWYGEQYESLSDDESITYFPYVPIETKAMEIALNTLFCGNNKMDYDPEDSTISITIDSSTDDLRLTSVGTDAYSYFVRNAVGVGYVDSPVDETQLSDFSRLPDWTMPFASNSIYSIGIAWFDNRYRTRGVIVKGQFKTGNMAYPILPQLEIAVASTDHPSWAAYYAVCVSKNDNYSRFYEGFASAVFFLYSDGGERYYVKQVNVANASQIISVVIDIAGMIKAGHVYSYAIGDRITLNYTDDSAATTYDFEVTGQDGNLVYAKFENFTSMAGFGDYTNYFRYDFIIYSPIQSSAQKVYYPVGELRPISELASVTTYTIGPGSINSTNLAPLIGDCVWDILTVPVYVKSPLKAVETTEPSKTIIGEATQSDATFQLNTSSSYTDTLSEIYENNFDGALASNQYTFSETYNNGKLVLSGELKITLPNAINDSLIVAVAFLKNGSTFVSANHYYKKLPITTSDGVEFTFKLFATQDIDGTNNFVSTDYLSLYFVIKTASTDVYSLYGNTTIELTGLQVEMQKADQNKIVYDLDPEVKFKTATKPVLIRRMNLTGKNDWSRYSGMPLLEATDDPVYSVNEIRHGGKYFENSKINNVSFFTALKKAGIPQEGGSIQALVRAARTQDQGNVLLCITKQRTYSVYLGETVVRDSGSTELLSLTSDMIGTINALKGDYGTTHPASIVTRLSNVYWFDASERKVIRYNLNGLQPISNIKMKSFFAARDGSPIGFYDPFFEMYYIWFSGDSSENHAVGWSEGENRWKTFLTFNPDVSAYLDDYFFSAVVPDADPVITKSLGTTYNNFFGPNTATSTKVKFMASSPVPIQPVSIVVRHNSDVTDWAQDNYVKQAIMTIVITNENGQQTTITSYMFERENNMLYAEVLMDENSAGGIIEGEIVEGYANAVELTINNTSSPQNQNQLAILVLSLLYQISSGHKL